MKVGRRRNAHFFVSFEEENFASFVLPCTADFIETHGYSLSGSLQDFDAAGGAASAAIWSCLQEWGSSSSTAQVDGLEVGTHLSFSLKSRHFTSQHTHTHTLINRFPQWTDLDDSLIVSSTWKRLSPSTTRPNFSQVSSRIVQGMVQGTDWNSNNHIGNFLLRGEKLRCFKY